MNDDPVFTTTGVVPTFYLYERQVIFEVHQALGVRFWFWGEIVTFSFRFAYENCRRTIVSCFVKRVSFRKTCSA